MDERDKPGVSSAGEVSGEVSGEIAGEVSGVRAGEVSGEIAGDSEHEADDWGVAPERIRAVPAPPRPHRPMTEPLGDAARPTGPVAAQHAPTRRRRITLQGMPVPEVPGRGIRQRVRRMVRDAVERQRVDTRRRVAIPVFALRVVVQVVRQWARDRCPQQAASLAFQTVLSIVPIVALTLATLRATGNLDAESILVKFLADSYIPVSQEKIAETLVRLSENITFQTLGMVGLVMTLGLAFVMFNTLERVMNDIWRTERRRPIAQKLVVFYAVATIVPLLAGLLLYQAHHVGVTEGFGGFVISVLAAWTGGFLCIYVLPKTEVRVRADAAGALVSALLFQLAKVLFSEYAQNIAFNKYSGIYGALAIAPLLLIWIYYSWLVLLLGCEVAFAAQHLHLLERGERRQRMPLDKELVERVNGVVAARMVVAIAEAYLTGKKVLSRRALADRFDVSDEVVDRIASRLKERDMLIEVEGDYVGFMPSRHPREIALADVLGAFRGDDVLDSAAHAYQSRLDVVLRDIEEATRERTRAIRIDDLVEEDQG